MLAEAGRNPQKRAALSPAAQDAADDAAPTGKGGKMTQSQRKAAKAGRQQTAKNEAAAAAKVRPEVARCPAPGWRWAEGTEWKQGPYEYRANFIGHAGAESTGSGVSTAVHGDWMTEMSTTWGNKSWVRRRRWTRAVERDPDIVWSGPLDKLKLAGFADRRWFVVTAEALCYYQLDHDDDSYENEDATENDDGDDNNDDNNDDSDDDDD